MIPAAMALDALPGETDDPRSDAGLMARVRAGDRSAFGELVERHKDGLVAYLARLSGCRDRAQDLAQEAFLRLFRAASGYRERGHLQAFLFRIATNLLRSEERRARRWRLVSAAFGAEGRSPAAPAPATAARAQERLLEDERRRALTAAVARLPLHLRAPLVLCEIEGWPQRQAAAALGCREGTIKSRLFRARERLRADLAPYRNGGPS